MLIVVRLTFFCLLVFSRVGAGVAGARIESFFFFLRAGAAFKIV
jgi:hypothetical protein